MESHEIRSDRLGVTVVALGAELVSLRHATAGELLWQAGPAWPSHAPVLFPIVGELRDGRYRHDGVEYAMRRHGFARRREFVFTERDDASATLVLRDDAETRAVYPFAFELSIRYAVAGDELRVDYAVRNPGEVPLPASLGAHPAFRWPLAPGVPKAAHALVFERDEPEPIRRLAANLLDPAPVASPINGKILHLDPALFDADAIVMDAPRSRSVRFEAPGAPEAPAIEVAWSGFEQLGIWSKGAGEFLCIEPWYGYASPAGFEGDFSAKPGLAIVAPGETRRFAMRVRASASA